MRFMQNPSFWFMAHAYGHMGMWAGMQLTQSAAGLHSFQWLHLDGGGSTHCGLLGLNLNLRPQ